MLQCLYVCVAHAQLRQSAVCPPGSLCKLDRRRRASRPRESPGGANEAIAASVAAGMINNGEYGMDAERFVACCRLLQLAVAGVAHRAFAQVSRERPGAVLGSSAVWAALFFCFVRALDAEPLSPRPLHKFVFDTGAVLALGRVKLLPLQYNLEAAASVARSQRLQGDSAILEQMAGSESIEIMPAAPQPCLLNAITLTRTAGRILVHTFLT